VINLMVSDTKHGLIVLSISVHTALEERMDLVNISGKTAQSMLETGNRIRSPELAFMIGLTVEATKENGWITTCKAWASTNGMMVVNFKVPI